MTQWKKRAIFIKKSNLTLIVASEDNKVSTFFKQIQLNAQKKKIHKKIFSLKNILNTQKNILIESV